LLPRWCIFENLLSAGGLQKREERRGGGRRRKNKIQKPSSGEVRGVCGERERLKKLLVSKYVCVEEEKTDRLRN
jgi:hypothetical protein